MAATLQSAVPSAPTPDSATQLSALLHAAATAPLDDAGWIRVTGSDRVRWLNGMVTNDIQSLVPGEGCYNFVLNAQGRIQGDLTAFAPANDPDALLLESSRAQLPTLLAHLDHFIIMDDVELAETTDDRAGVLLAGPQAAPILQRLGLATADLSTLKLQSAVWKKNPLDIIHAHSPVVPRFELWSDLTTILQIQEALTASGAASVSPEALEHLRILEGTPRYGTDIRNSETARDLPQETGQTRALHFSKGCYLGQEIVERIRSRGNVHRTFTGFELTGSLPAPGAALQAEGKPVGELTSVAAIPLPASTSSAARPIQLALGYVRREALADAQARGLTLEYPGGVARPVALPYPIS
jgi:folate-binding protein YgfZ